MRRRVDGGEGKAPPSTAAKDEAPRVQIVCDATNEASLVAGAFQDEATRDALLHRLVPDHFQQREHKELWQVFQEASRRKLLLDLALVEQLGTAELRAYLTELVELRPGTPVNLGYHVQTLLWDHARLSAARGPVPTFVEALRDPKAEPERVRGLARAVAQCFDGHEDRKYLLDPDQLVVDQMKEVDARVAGRATFSYGLDALDYYETFGPRDAWRRRMLPGPAPAQVTVITGISGGGKTTITANLVIGMAFPGWRSGDFETPGRRLLYGAWEMRGGMTLELLACISLGWSRSELVEGIGPVSTPPGREMLRARMEAIARRVTFLANPFRRRSGEKRSNERNLDLVQGYVADAGVDVFVADLWKRCLVDAEPQAEEEALVRQQAMVEELGVHAILLQQQRFKDVEMRPDKRPTREGIKGSGAWVEVADTIIGVHRPALFKRIDDDVLEVFVLKQRYGRWPLGIEFRWDPDVGMVSGGKPIEYERPGETNEFDRGSLADTMRAGKPRRKK